MQILEVATRHRAGDLALADGGELELVPFVAELVEELALALLAGGLCLHSADIAATFLAVGERLSRGFVEDGDRRTHRGDG